MLQSSSLPFGTLLINQRQIPQTARCNQHIIISAPHFPIQNDEVNLQNLGMFIASRISPQTTQCNHKSRDDPFRPIRRIGEEIKPFNHNVGGHDASRSLPSHCPSPRALPIQTLPPQLPFQLVSDPLSFVFSASASTSPAL